jgi:hypothetical protein
MAFVTDLSTYVIDVNCLLPSDSRSLKAISTQRSLSEVMQPMKQLPFCYRHFGLLF